MQWAFFVMRHFLAGSTWNFRSVRRFLANRVWLVPDARKWNGVRISFVTEQHWIVAQAALLLHICPDDLRRKTGRQLAVFAAFKQNGHYYLRIAPRRNAHEPAVIGKLLGCSALALAEHIAH